MPELPDIDEYQKAFDERIEKGIRDTKEIIKEKKENIRLQRLNVEEIRKDLRSRLGHQNRRKIKDRKGSILVEIL